MAFGQRKGSLLSKGDRFQVDGIILHEEFVQDIPHISCRQNHSTELFYIARDVYARCSLVICLANKDTSHLFWIFRAFIDLNFDPIHPNSIQMQY